MFNRNIEKETLKIINFIKDTFNTKGFSKAVIGISGGLDSAVIASLCVKALGKESVLGVLLPYETQFDIQDSELLIKFLDIPSETINIDKEVNEIFSQINIKGYNKTSLTRAGNIKARIRMIHLYDISMVRNALVVGTSNKTELEIGYFTLHGDGACALEPIGHLYKTEVKQLARYLKIPQTIIDKAPSAGLWEGQTDEDDIGMSYIELDTILFLTSNKNNDKLNEFISLLNLEDKQKTKKVLKIVEKNKFKLLPIDIIKD